MVAVALAGMFMTVVVATRVYALIPEAVGFALALGVGAVAATLAVRWSAKVIGAIGILGALLAPVLVGAPDDGATLAVLFSAALPAVGVLLWRRWDWLAFSVLLVCAPQWLAWLFGGPTVAAALLALIAFGALGHVGAIGFELRVPTSKLRLSSTLLVALNAAVLAIAGHQVLVQTGHQDAATLWLAALAALAVAHLLSALLAGRLRRVSSDIKQLLLTLAVLLGDVAFALLAHGPVLAAGWAATSVLFARIATRQETRRRDRALAELGRGGHLATALIVAISQTTGVLGQGPGDQIATTISLAAVAATTFTSARLAAGSHPWWRPTLNVVGFAVVAYLTAVDLQGAELVVAWALEAIALAKVARRTHDELAGIATLTCLAGAAVHGSRRKQRRSATTSRRLIPSTGSPRSSRSECSCSRAPTPTSASPPRLYGPSQPRCAERPRVLQPLGLTQTRPRGGPQAGSGWSSPGGDRG